MIHFDPDTLPDRDPTAPQDPPPFTVDAGRAAMMPGLPIIAGPATVIPKAGGGGTIVVHVTGGVCQDVTGLPAGWTYEVHDADEDDHDEDTCPHCRETHAEAIGDYLRNKTPGDRHPPADEDEEPDDSDRHNGSEYNPLDRAEPVGGWEGTTP